MADFRDTCCTKNGCQAGVNDLQQACFGWQLQPRFGLSELALPRGDVQVENCHGPPRPRAYTVTRWTYWRVERRPGSHQVDRLGCQGGRWFGEHLQARLAGERHAPTVHDAVPVSITWMQCMNSALHLVLTEVLHQFDAGIAGRTEGGAGVSRVPRSTQVIGRDAWVLLCLLSRCLYVPASVGQS